MMLWATRVPEQSKSLLHLGRGDSENDDSHFSDVNDCNDNYCDDNDSDLSDNNFHQDIPTHSLLGIDTVDTETWSIWSLLALRRPVFSRCRNILMIVDRVYQSKT